jgi:hypothetical protein
VGMMALWLVAISLLLLPALASASPSMHARPHSPAACAVGGGVQTLRCPAYVLTGGLC